MSDTQEIGQQFLVAAYRTTRALLICREQISQGQSLAETPPEVFDRREAIAPKSAFGHLAGEIGRLPIFPTPDSSQEEVTKIAIAHGCAAVELGYAPNDECLHWFHADQIADFFPSLHQLIELEFELLQKAGRMLVRQGRLAAAARLRKAFGVDPSPLERKDWAILPAAFLRDFSDLTTEDDRALAIARYESIRSRARESLDLRTELAAENAIARVKGLTFVDDTKSQRELVLLLGNRNGRTDAPVPQLPPAAS
jgi:hypothetical protein